jgi:separase
MTTADWLRCLSSNAYTVATQFWQKKNYAQSQIYGQRSCDLGLEAMTILHAERAKDKNVKDEYFAQLEEQLCRRYEMVGICHYKLGDSTVSLTGSGCCSMG